MMGNFLVIIAVYFYWVWKSSWYYLAGFFPNILLICHCCAIDNRLFTTQYKTKPAGKKKNMTENTSGMYIITFAWIGSGGVGFSLVCTNMETAIMIGKM